MAISATFSLSSTIPTTHSSSSSSSSPSQPSLGSHNSLCFNNGGISDLKKTNRLVINRNRVQRRNCRCMFGLGVPEIAVIAGVATLLFGPKKLPELGRSVGQTVKSFQKAAKEFESELRKESELPMEKQNVVNEEKQDNVSSGVESL